MKAPLASFIRCASPPLKRRRRLADLDIAEADIEQRLQLLLDLRNIFEYRQRVLDRRIEQVGDRQALVFDGQRFAVVTLAAADVAGDVNVGQKIHLDPLHPVALAALRSGRL